MERPEMNEIPLGAAMNSLFGGKPGGNVTMAIGQWDALLAEAYDTGWTLIEVDENEIPVKAYRNVTSDVEEGYRTWRTRHHAARRT